MEHVSEYLNNGSSIEIVVLYYETYLLENNFQIDLKNREIVFHIGDKKYNILDFKKVWYKQFGNSFDTTNVRSNNKFQNFYTAELREIQSFINSYIYENIVTFNSPLKGVTNKLQQLNLLNDLFVKIPETNVLNNYSYLNRNNKYITKSLSSPPNSRNQKGIKIGYTTKVTKADIVKDNTVFPSFFQEEVVASKEIRVFFFMNNIWAILIDTNRQKTIDYRVLNYNSEYKSYPIELNRSRKSEVRKIAKKLNLDSGSIDILIDLNDDFVYLEVNKYGQFGMIENSKKMTINILKIIEKYEIEKSRVSINY